MKHRTSKDWDDLLNRCFRNRRDEMFDQIRDLINGAVPEAPEPAAPERIEAWITESRRRWQQLVDPLPKGVGPQMPLGRFSVACEIHGERRNIGREQFADRLRASVVNHTGWPPYWYPTRRGIAPYVFDNAVECWLGGDPDTPVEDRDPAHSDFWRIHPHGLAFLIRGYQEDTAEAARLGRQPVEPGTMFDLTLPVWRIGESLLHAKRLADNLFEGPTTVLFRARYEGLSGRRLVSLSGNRMIREGRVAHQDSIELATRVDSQAIDVSLPEIVHPLLLPLYELFDMFTL